MWDSKGITKKQLKVEKMVEEEIIRKKEIFIKPSV